MDRISEQRPKTRGLGNIKATIPTMARQAGPEERRRLLEAAEGGPPKTPPIMIASLVMTLIAIGVLLWM